MDTTFERCGTPCGGINVKRLSRVTPLRKNSGSVLGNTWPPEKLPQFRQTSLNYARDFSSDLNLKSPEIKSSNDSAVDVDVGEINYPDHETNAGSNRKQKLQTAQGLSYKIENDLANFTYRSDEYFSNYRGVGRPRFSPGETGETVPEPIAAEQKLQKLKELQRKREFTERYYSQEIRKLINEYYRNSCSSGDLDKKQEKNITATSVSGNQQQQLCSVGKESNRQTPSLFKALEPCGTMTTITHLDCGCMQETTRPIFTTSYGRVENRKCLHGQNPALLKLVSSNPHEHLSLSNTETRGRPSLKSPSGSKLNRNGADPRIQITTRTSYVPKRIIQGFNPRCNLGKSKIDFTVEKQDLKIPETVCSSSFVRNRNESRNLSPLRKYSESSTD